MTFSFRKFENKIIIKLLFFQKAEIDLDNQVKLLAAQLETTTRKSKRKAEVGKRWRNVETLFIR